jgi:hypothetical protein
MPAEKWKDIYASGKEILSIDFSRKPKALRSIGSGKFVEREDFQYSK